MHEEIDFGEGVPCNDVLREAVATIVSWPDKYGVDVPVKNGQAMLGEELNDWIDSHKHYSSENEKARGIEIAVFGFALMIKFAEMEREFASNKEMDQ